MLRNTRIVRIEWGDCDPAGIIFYPRYFEIFDASTSILIERAIGMKKIEYLKAYDFVGHPVLETRAQFRLPTRFGDEVEIESRDRRLRPLQLQGRASAHALPAHLRPKVPRRGSGRGAIPPIRRDTNRSRSRRGRCAADAWQLTAAGAVSRRRESTLEA